MSRSEELVSFYASHYADSEKTESYCCLVAKGEERGAYAYRHWFSLKTSSFVKLEGGLPTEIVVTVPKWILEKKGIINLITKLDDSI